MRSLRTRLTITHAAAALAAVVLVAALTTALVRRGFDRLAVAQGRAAATAVAAALEQTYASRGALPDTRREIVRVLVVNRVLPPRRLVLAAPSGAVLLDTREGAGSLEGQTIPAALRGQTVPVLGPDGQTVALVAAPFVGDQGDLGQVEREFLARVNISVLIGSLVGGAAASALGLLMAARVATPLRRLTGAAQRLAAGERHTPIAPPNTAELAELAGSFNSMAAELERQEAMRRQLVADIAHDLRTPLSVLRLQLESIEDGVEQPTPAVTASLSEEVRVLTRLVDDLRLLSLTDAGQLSIAPQPLDAQAAIQHAAASRTAQARAQGIELRAETGVEPAPSVLADPQRLAQILGNLVENALRYTPRGGAVTLRAARQTLGGAPVVVLAVQDTGSGIAPEELARIFERFYRTDPARARVSGGSGLGLAIVQRLAELQGGRVWAESAPGRGSTFLVALPEAVSRPAPAAQRPQPPAGAPRP